MIFDKIRRIKGTDIKGPDEEGKDGDTPLTSPTEKKPPQPKTQVEAIVQAAQPISKPALFFCLY